MRKRSNQILTDNETMLDEEIQRMSKSIQLQHPLIVILFYGKKLPRYCSPMLRDPEPEANITINGNFEEIYYSVIKENPAIRDGAILVQINCKLPMIRGFSYRIHPPRFDVPREKNTGSGYNSSFDFSNVKRVKCVYYVNKEGGKKFIRGKEIKL